VKKNKLIVRAFARIHFCLVNLSSHGQRINGGAGMMVSPFAIEVEIAESDQLVVEPESLLNEVLFVCSRLSAKQQFRISVNLRGNMKWHYGMGLHTQLRLSIGLAISLLQSIPIQHSSFSQKLSRGGTSGVGSLGFWHGGVIFDGGHERELEEEFLPSSAIADPKLAPLVYSRRSMTFVPVIAQARGWNLVYGKLENELFSLLTPIPSEEANECAKIVYENLQSAVIDSNFDSFCESIESIQTVGFKQREINFRQENAKHFQQLMRASGLHGIGMSSWGPTWYGFANTIDNAAHAVRFLLKNSAVESAWIADFAPGAQIECSDGSTFSALSATSSVLGL
jgi:beta-ribofuranosylaminobenzene 5'-phosphate synthase